MTKSIADPPNGRVDAKRRRIGEADKSEAVPMPSTDPTDEDVEEGDGEEKTSRTSKCKGATTIPIFLKKTYKMIDTCNPEIASWTPDGDMFVVLDSDAFAETVIPQYFDHNKFSSFARQLNFYGFRKMQAKPIRNSDFDANTAKHVTFFNQNFKRDRCDLLKKIQRSTRGGGSNAPDQQKEVKVLKEQITSLEKTISVMGNQMEERMRRLELDMLGRMEQMMLAMQQQQQTQQHLQVNNSPAEGGPLSNQAVARGPNGIEGWDPVPYGARGNSIGSFGGLSAFMNMNPGALGLTRNISGGAGPTLPPHPKQKSLPSQGLPGALSLPTGRLTSLRGLSHLSRGISGLSRGASVESQGSGVLSNTWEDKFFSMLMTGDKTAAANFAAAALQQGNADAVNPTPMSDRVVGQANRLGDNAALLAAANASYVGAAGLGV